MKQYNVRKAKIDNSENNVWYVTEDMWERSEKIKDFSRPWSNLQLQKTTFRAVHNGQFLYLRYDVMDKDIHIYLNKEDKMDVIKSDRIEIFFKKDDTMKPYYCLEIDPLARVLDYKASHYRQFDYQWAWPKGQLDVKTNQSSIGYQIDIALSLKSLNDLGLLKNDRIQAGIYRADCKSLLKDDNKDQIFQWITWVDPKTHNPDFHVPSSFGVLNLE